MNILLVVVGIVVFIVIANSVNIALKSGVENTKDRIMMFLQALSTYIIIPAVLYGGISIITDEINAISVICIIFVIIYAIDIAVKR